jgi:hypothetical protein
MKHFCIGAMGVLAMAAAGAEPASPSAKTGPRVLVYEFSRLAAASERPQLHLRNALARLAEDNGLSYKVTRDQGDMIYDSLRAFDVVIFSNGGGDVLSKRQAREDLERYVREGGGFIAIHDAGTFISKLTFLKQVVGPSYLRVSDIGERRISVSPAAAANPDYADLFRGLPPEVALRDRWLSFRPGIQEDPAFTVLWNLNVPGQGPRPIVWTRQVGKGKTLYNSMGAYDVYAQAEGFGRRLLWNSIEYVRGAAPLGKMGTEALPAAAYKAELKDGRLFLTLPEGRHEFRALDSRGRAVASGSFEGPGRFQVAGSFNGGLVLTLNGPAGKLTRTVTAR